MLDRKRAGGVERKKKEWVRANRTLWKGGEKQKRSWMGIQGTRGENTRPTVISRLREIGKLAR